MSTPHHHDTLSLQDSTILAETFRLLGDPSRLRILFYCLNEPKSVGDIEAVPDPGQPPPTFAARGKTGCR